MAPGADSPAPVPFARPSRGGGDRAAGRAVACAAGPTHDA